MPSNVTENLTSIDPVVLISLASVLTVAAILTIAGNVIIIFVIFRTPSFHKSVFILTANISVADLVYLVLVSPQYVTSLVVDSNFPPLGSALCYVQVYVSNGTIAVTIYLMAATAVCRTLRVCYPNVYSNLCKPRTIAAFLMAVWAVPLIICGFCDKGIKYDRTKFICMFSSPTYLYALGGFVYVPSLIIMLVAYIQILRFIRQSRRRVEASVATGAIHVQKDKHVFKLVVAVVLVFVLSNTVPSVFYSVSHWYSKHIYDLIGSWLGRLRPIANFVSILVTCTYLRQIIHNTVWRCPKH